jgi:hypothetical protein
VTGRAKQAGQPHQHLVAYEERVWGP